MGDATCDGCIYRSGNGKCRAFPPVLVEREEWVDSGHPMLGDALVKRDEWVWPPATHRCVHYKETITWTQ